MKTTINNEICLMCPKNGRLNFTPDGRADDNSGRMCTYAMPYARFVGEGTMTVDEVLEKAMEKCPYKLEHTVLEKK